MWRSAGPPRPCWTPFTSAQQRQAWYRDEALSAGEPPKEFIGSLKTTDGIASSAALLRDALGFDIEQRRQLPTWTEALRGFTEQAETLGILVMVSGVVGNNTHRGLDPEEFRGFALPDPLAPPGLHQRCRYQSCADVHSGP